MDANSQKTCDVRDTRVLKLSQELDEGFPQGGHDVGRIVHGQTTNQRYRGDAVLEHLIVDSDEERTHILSLGEMLVEAFVQGR